MSWREQLLTASFRGVEFFVDNADSEFGRRVAVHEYPLIDRPETEDLGERPRSHSLNAYVLGTDYFPARDRLEAALNMPGPGELVHPYRGTLTVVVTGWRLSESTREGGLARFSISVLEFEVLARPSAVADTARVLRTAADEATTAEVAQAEPSFDLRLDRLRERLIAPVTDVLKQIERVIGIAGVIEEEVIQILETPRTLITRVEADIRRIAFLADVRRLFGYIAPGRRETGAAQANRDALARMVQSLATIHAARLCADLVFASRDDAFSLRNELLLQFDAVSLSADDDLFPRLLDARAALVEDIRARSTDLARITYHTPSETLPALVIAHTLYGTSNLVERADEVVARNRIAHPGFVPGGTRLEVLSD